MRMICGLSMVGLLLAARPGEGANAQGRFMVYGVGNKTCAQFLNSKASTIKEYAGWIAGYLTMVNMMRDGTMDVLQTDVGAVSFVDFFEGALLKLRLPPVPRNA